MTRKILAVWDNTGFEYLQDISELEPTNWEKQQLLQMLQDKPVTGNPLNGMLNYFEMRARANQQRHYEIYTFDIDDSIDELDLQHWAETDAQTLVDWIRENGVKLYSDRKTEKDVIV